jgi:hypothetical protein
MTESHSRSSTIMSTLAMTLALVAAAGPAAAQYRNAVETQVADLENLRDKFLSLAEAFPAETYPWRPMEGVRSVHDVMALMVAECVLFPTMWGFEAAEWMAEGFRGEMARLGELSKDELIGDMRRSFEHLLGIVKGLTDEDRARHVEFFGREVDLGTAVDLMANDMHEHLGQAVAYARTNQIVPPWSRREGQ